MRGLRTVEQANRFLGEEYIAEFNQRFQVPAAQKGSAFVPCRHRDLDLVFSLQSERTVNKDNTVSFQNLVLQIEKVQWRGTLAGCMVIVHQHLDGTLSITYGPQRLGRYTGKGELIVKSAAAAEAVEKTLPGKVKKPTFPPRLEIPQTTRHPTFQQLRRRRPYKPKPDISLATKKRTFHLLRTDGVMGKTLSSMVSRLLHVEGDGGRMLHGPTRSRYRDAIVLRLRRGYGAATTSGEAHKCRSGEEKDCHEQQLLQPLR